MFLVKMFSVKTSGICVHGEEFTLSFSTSDDLLATATEMIRQVKMHQLNHSRQMQKNNNQSS